MPLEIKPEKINWEKTTENNQFEKPQTESELKNSAEETPNRPESNSPEKENEISDVNNTERGENRENSAENLTRLEEELAKSLEVTDFGAEGGEKQIDSLIEKIAENLVINSDASPSRITKEKETLIEKLSNNNLSTYGYLQEIFNREIGKKLGRKNY